MTRNLMVRVGCQGVRAVEVLSRASIRFLMFYTRKTIVYHCYILLYRCLAGCTLDKVFVDSYEYSEMDDLPWLYLG